MFFGWSTHRPPQSLTLYTWTNFCPRNLQDGPAFLMALADPCPIQDRKGATRQKPSTKKDLVQAIMLCHRCKRTWSMNQYTLVKSKSDILIICY